MSKRVEPDGIPIAALAALLRGQTYHAAVAMTPGGIEEQEAMGQRELVATQRLPLEGPWDELEKLGVKRGEKIDGLFCHASLPDGWKIEADPNSSYWSDLKDGAGKARAVIFYKAAFYDRSAFFRMSEP